MSRSATPSLALHKLAFQLLCLIPSGLEAQTSVQPFHLDSGTVVRLELHSGIREKGKLLSPYTPDSTHLRYCHYPAPPCRAGDERYREKPGSDVSRMEVRRGSAWLPGLVIGGVVGVGFGLLMVAFVESMSEVPSTTGEEITAVVGSAAFFGSLGTLIGSGFEKWGVVNGY